MDQTTCFSPPIHVRLFGGRVAKFARSTIEHWIDLCEQYKAAQVEQALAEIDAIPPEELGHVARAAARAEVREMEVPIGAMVHRCIQTPAWIKRHLLASLSAAGESDGVAVLALIPWQQQQEIAHAVASLPVVRNDPTGTAENPLKAGVEFASTGASTSASSSDSAPASPSAD